MKRAAALIWVVAALGLVAACSKVTEEKLVDRAKTLEEQQKYEDAMKVYKKLVRQFPKGKYADEAQYKIAWIYYNEDKDFKKAVAAHEKLVKNYPDSRFAERSRFMIGYIYANDLRDYDKARTAYEDFLNHYPKSELADDVTWELKHLGQDINLLDFVDKGNKKSSNGKSTDGSKSKK